MQDNRQQLEQQPLRVACDAHGDERRPRVFKVRSIVYSVNLSMFAAVYVFMYAPVIMQPLRKCTHMCVRAYDGGTSVVVTYVNFYFGGKEKHERAWGKK